jgi:hypothetical protein
MNRILLIVLVLLVSVNVCLAKVLERDQYGNPTKMELIDKDGNLRQYNVSPGGSVEHHVVKKKEESWDGKYDLKHITSFPREENLPASPGGNWEKGIKTGACFIETTSK